MPTLKRARELTWGDLQSIEAPHMAIRTVKEVHGAKYSAYGLQGAHNFNLPKQRDTRIDPYSIIEAELNNGQAFLVNHGTMAPLLETLSVNDSNQAQWTFRGHVNDMMRNAFMMAMMSVPVPVSTGVLRQEPSEKQTETEVQKKEREKHVILLNLEGQNDRPLPAKHNITLYVENTTQGTTAVRQLNDVIYNPFSRVFSTEKGDKLKVYAIPDNLVEARKDLNDNKSLAQSESKGLIAPLEETAQETRQDGATLHHITYKVPNNYIELELLDEEGEPLTGVAYKILNKNGKVIAQGVVDRSGYALVPGVDVNEAEVIFTEIEQEAMSLSEEGR